jgi:uncharacterized membrane protein YbhN (UPF0104 family)
MPSPAPRSRVPWHALLIGVLTAGFLWWFFHNLNFGEVWRSIEGANLKLIAMAVGVTLVTYVLRAFRWQALLRPIGHATFRNAFRTTVIGFTACCARTCWPAPKASRPRRRWRPCSSSA